MAWDGSGNFSRTKDWTNDRDAAIKILASRHDENDDELTVGIAACLTKNGESKPTSDVKPNADATLSLGSSALRWVNAWVSGALKIKGAAGTGTLVTATLTTDRTYTLPDAGGTVLTQEAFAATALSLTQLPDSMVWPGPINLGLAISVAGNALTIALKGLDGNNPSASNKVIVPFRSNSLTTGTAAILSITSALSLVIPSGATLGTTANVPARLWILLFNDGGTPRFGVVNTQIADGLFHIADDEVVDSTTISTGADSAGVIYTDSGVSGKAMRVVGYLEVNESTAGTWASEDSKVQLYLPGMKLPGDRVQYRRNQTGLRPTPGGTDIPVDDTVPTAAEGDLYMSQAITPTSTINRLRVHAQVNGGTDAAANQTLACALHQDSGVALVATSVNQGGGTGASMQMHLDHEMVAGTTSATTFKARAGCVGANNFDFNGLNNARIFGGVNNSYIQVEEIMA